MVAKIQASNTGVIGMKGCWGYVCQNTLFAIAPDNSRKRVICQGGNTIFLRDSYFF